MNSLLKKFFSNDYLLTIPYEQSYLKFILAFYAAFCIFVIAYTLFYGKRHGKNKILKSFRKIFFWGNASLGLTGLFFVFSRSQGLPLFSLRIMNFLLLILIVAYNIYLVIHYKKKVLVKLSIKREQDRVAKWLPKNKKA